jgi:hypothetical protein
MWYRKGKVLFCSEQQIFTDLKKKSSLKYEWEWGVSNYYEAFAYRI